MKIFVSYPEVHSGYAQKLIQALVAQRHELVSERLPPASRRPLRDAEPGAVRDAEHDAMVAADLFIFVLAPESLAAGSATRLALRRAQRRWPEPAGHVLTVPVAPTPWQDIPSYLRQCTRVRAPGPGTVIPDASVCAAAVAELEKRRRDATRHTEGPPAQRRAAPDAGPHSAPHSAPDSRPYSAADSTTGGGHEGAVVFARPAKQRPNQAKPAVGAPAVHAPPVAAPSVSVPAVRTPPFCAPPVAPSFSAPPVSTPPVRTPAAGSQGVGAQALSAQAVGVPTPGALAAGAPTLGAAAIRAPAVSARAQSPALAGAAGGPIVAHPAHAADWAGQRSWRRGKSRSSSRRRSRKPGSLWGLVRRHMGVSLAVGGFALLLLVGLAWQWMRLAPAKTGKPERPSAELVELSIADPVARKVQRALRQCREGSFGSALQQLTVQASVRGAPSFVHQAREDCAMAWLRGAEVRPGDSNFTQLVEPLRPLLVNALAVAPVGQRMADLRAHLGWADFLTWLDTRSPQHVPLGAYQAALALDPGNSYAQAMAAVWFLIQGQGGAPLGATLAASGTAGGAGVAAPAGTAAEAMPMPMSSTAQVTSPGQLALARQALAQFQAATATALARRQAGDREALAFVRRVQLSSLGSVPEMSAESVRMLDDMRRGNEPQEPQLLQLAWSSLYAQSYQESAQQRLQAALPAEDNLRTFLWCFPKSEPGAQQDADRSVWRLVHGMLLTHAGRGREARADLAALHAEVRMNLGAAEFSRAVDRLLSQRQ
jgi:hypothetical protein